MDHRLLEYAKEAVDVAAGLQVFHDEVPEYAKDITANIAELFAISNGLHVLNENLALSRYGKYAGYILGHLDVVIPSLGHTLRAIRRTFGKTKRQSRVPGAFPVEPQYNMIWDDMCLDLKDEGIDLPLRLEYYRIYLQGLSDVLRGDPMDQELDRIRTRLTRLLRKQEPLDAQFGRVTIDPNGRRTPKPKSPTTSRPTAGRYSTYPAFQHVPAPAPPPVPPPPLPPRSPAFYPEYDRMPPIPPPAPQPPQSPTFSTTSSQTYSTYSNDSGSGTVHWAQRIFDGRHSSTPFRTPGQTTRCLGRDEPSAGDMLDSDGFIKVVELPFEATDVWVRLYWRAADQRARVLFLTHDQLDRKMRYCIPLTALKVLRTDSCLQLCRVNRADGRLDLWANLKFTLYERMVLFYCTMVAMKCQDNIQTPPGLEDYFQPGETEEYGGQIQDDRYIHALRIFRDDDSGCVRFEVTARRGPMKAIPIWTAFVTEFIRDRHWMRRTGTSTIRFGKLHPYVFCDGYSPPRGPTGKYELTFTSSEDARDFMDIFHHIRR